MTRADPTSIALVTGAEYPTLPPDDLLLVSALGLSGLHPVAARWDDPSERWADHGAVVLRSCYEYHRHATAFARWLDRLEQDGARVHNAVPTLRWNMRKSYLRDLEKAGIPVAETVWTPVGSETSLRRIAESTGWTTMVVKPVVSTSAHETWLVERAGGAADEERFARQLRERDLMVQAFLPAIATEGELSHVFIAGSFSHAVRKRPKAGDFRVQEEHGGSAEREVAAPDLVRQAARALTVAPEPPLYARVDGAVVNGSLVVTELELIEPMLYFGWDPAAARRLAAALTSALERP